MTAIRPPPSGPHRFRRVSGQEWWRTEGSFFLLSEAHRSEGEGQRALAFLQRVVPLPPGARVLDLACGWGRVAIPLARQGYRVVGVDLSPVLRLGRQLAREEGLGVDFLRADLRRWTCRSRFDLVLLWGMSFGYFPDEENSRLLARVRSWLGPEGRAVLDLHHPPWYERHYVGEQVELIPGGVLHDEVRWDASRRRMEVMSTLATGEGRVRARQFHDFREYSPQEAVRLARSAGLRTVSLHGGLRPQAGPPRPDDSSFQIVLARGRAG
jgi:SAM-dependent methyltransferase